MPHTKVTKFKYPIDPRNSFVLGVSKDINYYIGTDLAEIIGLLSRTFSEGQSAAAATSSDSTKKPARILLYADSLNAFNRRIYHCMYPSNPVSKEQAMREEEQDAEVWFNGKEGLALRRAIAWTHILRWRNIEEHPSFAPALKIVKGLYKARGNRPPSLQQCDQNEKLIAQYRFSEKIDSLVGKRVAENAQKIQAWNREHPDKLIAFDGAEAVRLNRKYLFHECAGEFTVVAIAEESGEYFAPQHVLYPGIINEALGFVHQIIQDEYQKQHPDSRRAVMHENPIRLPHSESKPIASTSRSPSLPDSPISESPPRAPVPMCAYSAPLATQGVFALPPAGRDIGQLSARVAKFTIELNGKFADFQQTLVAASAIKASGKTLPPQMARDLAYISEYIERLSCHLERPLNHPQEQLH